MIGCIHEKYLENKEFKGQWSKQFFFVNVSSAGILWIYANMDHASCEMDYQRYKQPLS